MSEALLPHAAFQRKNTLQNPSKCMFPLMWTTFPDPYFSDRLSHLSNELWHEYLYLISFFSTRLFTFFPISVADIIKMSWCIREHLSHWILLLLASLPDKCLPKYAMREVWPGLALTMERRQLGDGEPWQSVLIHCWTESTSVSHSHL